MQNVLFICEGNIIRSPLAKGLFLRAVEQAGLTDRFSADAAGTASYHVGESPDSRMQQVAAGRGFRYSHTARQVRPADLDHYDLIVAMDARNLANLRRLARTPEQQNRLRLLREFEPRPGAAPDVPDPYYGGLSGFEEVYDIIERCTAALVAHLAQADGPAR